MGFEKLDLSFDHEGETPKQRRKRIAGENRQLRREHQERQRKSRAQLNLPTKSFKKGGERKPANWIGPGRVNVKSHRASTATFAAAFPFLAQGSLGHRGAYIGQNLSGGGSFCADPFEWYNSRYVDGTSMVLIGTVGTGKSTCAKSWVTRLVLSGRKAACCSDLKGEWVPVARFLGGGVISVGPGRSTRINPLDAGRRPSTTQMGQPMTDQAWAMIVRTRRFALLNTILGILLRVDQLEPEESSALKQALDLAVGEEGEHVTIRAVVERLHQPQEDSGEEVTRAAFRLYHALSRMIDGDLAGMFDGESTESFDPDLPMMVIDTSALKGASAEARRITNACTSAWVEAAVTNPDSGQRILIYEEGWDSMSDAYTLARMVEQWKLAREYGIANLLIMHKVADSDLAGDSGSQTQAMARSLITDAEIRIVYRQKPDALAVTQEVMGLTDSETQRVRRLPKGVGLWKVSDRYSFIVHNIISEVEKPIFDTDKKMYDDLADEYDDEDTYDFASAANTGAWS